MNHLPAILSYGVTGLGAILGLLAYRGLHSAVREAQGLRAYYAFLGFSALLIIAGLTGQFLKPASDSETAALRQQTAVLERRLDKYIFHVRRNHEQFNAAVEMVISLPLLNVLPEGKKQDMRNSLAAYRPRSVDEVEAELHKQ